MTRGNGNFLRVWQFVLMNKRKVQEEEKGAKSIALRMY